MLNTITKQQNHQIPTPSRLNQKNKQHTKT